MLSTNQGRKKALIIAVSEYEEISGLKKIEFCKNDGDAMVDVLGSHKYENIEKLIGKVDGDFLKRSIDNFFDYDANTDDTLLFYFSGHGVIHKKDIYLASSTIEPNRPKNGGFSLTNLNDCIKECEAKNVIVILDTCYAGSAAVDFKFDPNYESRLASSAATHQNKIFKKIGNESSDLQGRCLLSSCTGFQQSFNHKTEGCSFFTYYLVNGLSGANGKSVSDNGTVTPESLMKYVNHEIEALPPDESRPQTPFDIMNNLKNFEIISYPEYITRKEQFPDRFTGQLNDEKFVEPDNQVDKVTGLLEQNSIVSIMGEGGMGKTQLAFKVIHRCRDKFEIVVPLYFDKIQTTNDVLREFKDILSLPDNSTEQHIQKILAKKHVLIFIDSYENISSQETLSQLDRFFESCSTHTKILITSREKKINSLVEPYIIEDLSNEAGLQVFIKNTDKLYRENLTLEIHEKIKILSEKTGGHPLALALLAGSYHGSHAEFDIMIENLGHTISNNSEEKHTSSLRASFEYSYNKLDTEKQQSLEKLILFSSHFMLTAAKEILDIEESTMLELYNKSFLRRQEDLINQVQYVHYYFHQSIRGQLEIKQNVTNLDKKFKEKFIDYYLKMLLDAHDNMGKNKSALVPFNIIIEGENNDFKKLLNFLESDKSEILSKKTNAARLLGKILSKQEQYITAQEYYTISLKIHNRLNELEKAAKDYRDIGILCFKTSNSDKALEYHKKALDIHIQSNKESEQAIDYRNIGLSYSNSSNYKETFSNYHKALDIHKKLKNTEDITRDYVDIGNFFMMQGFYSEAKDYYGKVINTYKKKHHDVPPELDINFGIGRYLQGDYKNSLKHFENALKKYKKTLDVLRIADCHSNIGKVLQSMPTYILLKKNIEKSTEHHNEALEHHNEALEHHNEASEYHKSSEDRIKIANNYYNQSLILLNNKKSQSEGRNLLKKSKEFLNSNLEDNSEAKKYLRQNIKYLLENDDKSKPPIKDSNVKSFFKKRVIVAIYWLSLNILFLQNPTPNVFVILILLFLTAYIFLQYHYRKQRLKKIGFNKNIVLSFSFRYNIRFIKNYVIILLAIIVILYFVSITFPDISKDIEPYINVSDPIIQISLYTIFLVISAIAGYRQRQILLRRASIFISDTVILTHYRNLE